MYATRVTQEWVIGMSNCHGPWLTCKNAYNHLAMVGDLKGETVYYLQRDINGVVGEAIPEFLLITFNFLTPTAGIAGY